MDIHECFDKRLLKKIPASKYKIEASLKIAERKLNRAKELFNKDFFEEAFVLSYTSMFHAARALLYKDGVQEKSHFATHLYIKDKYSDKISDYLIGAFKNYQLERHNILYGFDIDVPSEKSENAILDAEEFLGEVKKIYGKN